MPQVHHQMAFHSFQCLHFQWLFSYFLEICCFPSVEVLPLHRSNALSLSLPVLHFKSFYSTSGIIALFSHFQLFHIFFNPVDSCCCCCLALLFALPEEATHLAHSIPFHSATFHTYHLQLSHVTTVTDKRSFVIL